MTLLEETKPVVCREETKFVVCQEKMVCRGETKHHKFHGTFRIQLFVSVTKNNLTLLEETKHVIG